MRCTAVKVPEEEGYSGGVLRWEGGARWRRQQTGSAADKNARRCFVRPWTDRDGGRRGDICQILDNHRSLLTCWLSYASVVGSDNTR
uniref:Uncharacterized protein n=1 Tax=Physcomitrium patens TaxID=3218 RepID=A0A2K1KPY1_PHYPA|nr:hypothetical protein PHYPA_006750 [Physcomitrium patens]